MDKRDIPGKIVVLRSMSSSMVRGIINDHTQDQIDDLPNLIYEYSKQKSTLKCHIKCYYMDEIILFEANAYANNGKQLDKLIKKFTEQILNATQGNILVSQLRVKLPRVIWEKVKLNQGKYNISGLTDIFIDSILAYENSGGKIFSETFEVNLSDPYLSTVSYYDEKGFTILPFDYERIFKIKLKEGPSQAQRIQMQIKNKITPILKKKSRKDVPVIRPMKPAKLKAFEPRKPRTQIGSRKFTISRRRIERKNVKELK